MVAGDERSVIKVMSLGGSAFGVVQLCHCALSAARLGLARLAFGGRCLVLDYYAAATAQQCQTGMLGPAWESGMGRGLLWWCSSFAS